MSEIDEALKRLKTANWYLIKEDEEDLNTIITALTEAQSKLAALQEECDKQKGFVKDLIADSTEAENALEKAGIKMTDNYGAVHTVASGIEELTSKLTLAEQRLAKVEQNVFASLWVSPSGEQLWRFRATPLGKTFLEAIDSLPPVRKEEG